MPTRHRSAVEAAARASTVEEARAAVDEPGAIAPQRGAGSQDPLIGDLRRGGLLPLLVLHFVAKEPCYGNQLIERIGELTAGALTVNPNTMYPLLRQLEARGLISGEWEHPERRSRRFYRITDAGVQERKTLDTEVGVRLKRIGRSIQVIRRELRT
jgi:PadR family transcriptional regulator, regulatory protein PadR